MQTVTTSTADAVLKSYYLSAVSDLLKTSVNPLLAQIRHTTADVWGKDVRKLAHVGINGGVGAGSETGELPTPQANNYVTFVSPLKNLYGSVEISDKALRASASNEGAFVNLLNDEMEQVIKSATFNFSRMLFGDGTGLLGTVSAAASTELTVDTVNNFEPGMLIDLYNPSDVVQSKGLCVERVDYATGKIKINAAMSSATGYKVYLHGCKDMELTGLKAIFSDKPLYGVTRTGNSALIPYSTTCETLTENEIQKAIDAVEMKTGGKINFIVCSWGVRRAIFDILSKYRYSESVVLNGGFHAITFNGIPIVADRFCPEGTMYLLNTDDFALHQLCDWQWLEGNDGKILRQIQNKPVYSATLVKYAELMCYNPGGQAVITGITEA